MERFFEAYERANLKPLLSRIREDGRYRGANGLNVLTNAAFGDEFRRDEVLSALAFAEAAGRRGETSFEPRFTSAQQGLSYGLNPYTDWSVSLLKQRPNHAYLFLGLDWYSISKLGHTETWFEYLANPFVETTKDKDAYWHRLWAWILRKTKRGPSGKPAWDLPVVESEAADFVRRDGGLFIFHNLVPYLRPAGSESTQSTWYEEEWTKGVVRTNVREELSLLRELAGPRIVTYCTKRASVDVLLQAGFQKDRVFSWGAHPSKASFNPAAFYEKKLWFVGAANFR